MKITLNPIKEVFINYLVKLDIGNITKERGIVERALTWSNGYLITLYEDDKDFVIEKKYKNGILYVETVLYAKCSKITESKVDGIIVSVLDYSNHLLFKEIAKAIPKLEAEI